MENPVKEAPRLIHTLCSGTPAQQYAAIEANFARDAAFRHTICRVPRFGDVKVKVPLLGGRVVVVNSRWVIGCVYRWYKVLSPRVEVDVESVVFDRKTLRLYVSMTQVFSLFFIPFYYAKVPLITVLRLERGGDNNDDGRFYIGAQEDYYEPEDFVRFFLPGAHWVVRILQWLAVVVSVLCALLIAPPVKSIQRIGGWKMD